MEAAHLTRLREEQDKAIVETDEKIAQWEEMKSNYQSLQDRLNSLSHKVTHDIMVPFGPCAFMPGKMIHTNEITVLLGENWFVERSAVQASEIASRRIGSIEKSLSDLNEQKKLLQPRVDITSELQNIAEEKNGVREIREEYDPEEDQIWREKHRKSVQAHKQKLKAERQGVKIQNKTELTDEELWARLDQLEEIETKRKELQRLRSEESPVVSSFVQTQPDFREPAVESTESPKHIHWQDSQSDESYDEESSNEDKTVLKSHNKITFSHTPTSSPEKDPILLSDESNGNVTSTTDTQITSPSDIYKQFGHVIEPKSILKKNSKKQSVRKAREAEIEDSRSKCTGKKMSATAFTGTVLEKSSTSSSQPVVAFPTHDNKSTENQRPVSKFRAARQKQNED